MRFDVATQTVHAAGRTWRVDPGCTNVDDFTTGRMTHRDRRVMVRFESGWSASIIWGSGTYSSNHDAWDFEWEEHRVPFTEEPTTVEVGVLDRGGVLRQRRIFDPDGGHEYTDVEAYLDDDALVALLDELAKLPTDFDYGEPPPPLEEVIAAMERFGEQFGFGLGQAPKSGAAE